MEMKAVKMAAKTASGGEILDQSVSEIEDRGGGGGVFRESSPPFRASTFSYI